MADPQPSQKRVGEPPVADDREPVEWDPIDWTSPSTWPLSLKFAPVAAALLGVFISIYANHFMGETVFDPSSLKSCRATFDHTYFINAARRQAESRAENAWEFGTAAHAIEELIDPDKTVFGSDPFPDGKIPGQGFQMDQAMIWVYQHIRSEDPTLFDDAESATAPAALGVPAIMVGQRWPDWVAAAERQKEYLVNEAPRHKNGAISHLRQGVQIRAEDLYTFAPFLAYHAVQTNDSSLAREALKQIEHYRDLLRIPSGSTKGLWRHMFGKPEGKQTVAADTGAWSTANALAVYGMLRVRATIAAWTTHLPPNPQNLTSEFASLDLGIAQIVDAARHLSTQSGGPVGLLPNYLGNGKSSGETTGSALFAAVVYRLAVLKPDHFANEIYLSWADQLRTAVVAQVDDEGSSWPAADLGRWEDRVVHAEKNAAAPETEAKGGSFAASALLTMSSAWRDCVCAGVCHVQVKQSQKEEL